MSDSGGLPERRRRWRLILGPEAERRAPPEAGGLSCDDAGRDAALTALYNGTPGARDNRSSQGPRGFGLQSSAPMVARWLGDIRRYFPTSVVRILQADAMERLGLRQLLLEPELLQAVEPDVSLVATLVGLNDVIPEHSRDTARAVVRTVTEALEARLAEKTRSAITGALDRQARTRRPTGNAIDWSATIRANLRHYQPAYRTVIPERLIGYQRRHRAVQREVILAVDQSGSMAGSVVYASVFAAVLAGMRTIGTHLVVFDTEVVDLTEVLRDPVDVLFATQLGGGTDINRAVTYCQSLVTRPRDTVLVLISDLVEGGLAGEMVGRMAALVKSGVVAVVLLALNDDGSPAYDHAVAQALASVGVVAFACTPDQFPELMAAALERRDLRQWAAERGITAAAPEPTIAANSPDEPVFDQEATGTTSL